MNGFAIIDATLNWPNVDGPAVAARTAENRKGKLAKGLEAVPLAASVAGDTGTWSWSDISTFLPLPKSENILRT